MSKTRITISSKDAESSGLLKIPSEVVIKQLRLELGQSKSYIEELENEISRLKVLKNADTGHYDHSYRNECGVFTLEDMLNILPKEIDECSLHIYSDFSMKYRHFLKGNVREIYYSLGSSYLESAYNMVCSVSHEIKKQQNEQKVQ